MQSVNAVQPKLNQKLTRRPIEDRLDKLTLPISIARLINEFAFEQSFDDALAVDAAKGIDLLQRCGLFQNNQSERLKRGWREFRAGPGCLEKTLYAVVVFRLDREAIATRHALDFHGPFRSLILARQSCQGARNPFSILVEPLCQLPFHHRLIAADEEHSFHQSPEGAII